MMQHNITFDRESGYNTGSYNSAQRKNRMKRMEEISHSLDDGLNNLPDDYNGRYKSSSRQRHSNSSRQQQQQQHEQQFIDEMEDPDDFFEDDYNDDYYYNKLPGDGNRPRSYNEKYSPYMYDDYEPNQNFSRNRYSLNETSMPKNDQRYQSSPMSQQKYSSLRKQAPSSSAQSSATMSGKHILFNDEDDIHYMSDNMKSNQKKLSTSTTAATSASQAKKDMMKTKEKETATVKKKVDEMKMSKEKTSSLQVMKAKLKIHNLSNDDSVLGTRNVSTASKSNTFLRHHSVEAKLPSHHTERNNLSPTILEEIEFETQDDAETETEKESEYDAIKNVIESERDADEKSSTIKKKNSKEKQSKDKKGNSVPSTPTTKKSLKAHLTNKRLFKVPDIDLNNLKLSCFFSSSKNIAALKSKKEVESTSKSAEQLNELSFEPQQTSSTLKSKTPPSTPKNKKSTRTSVGDIIEEQQQPQKQIVNSKQSAKCEKVGEKMSDEKIIKSNSQGKIDRDREMRGKTVHTRDEDSFSDIEVESQAMKVVRTVGQAFEVCHKISMNKKQDNNDDNSEIISDLDQSDIQNLSDFDEPKKILESTPIIPDSPQKVQSSDILSLPLNNFTAPPSPSSPKSKSSDENSREIQLLREQLQQQTQQTKQTLAQLILVREQLLTETNARIEAQARTQQLLQQNRELLEHIASFSGLNESERTALTPAAISMTPQSQLPLYLQTLSLLGSSTPTNLIPSPNILTSQKSNEDDIKNNNSPLKVNSGSTGTFNFDSLSILQNTMQTYNQLQKLGIPQQQQQQQNHFQQQQELYQLNCELLNRLRNLNVGYSTIPTTAVSTSSFTPSPTTPGLPATFSSDTNFMLANLAAQNYMNDNNNNNNNNVSSNNNNNASINMVPTSPIGTLNRSSSTYSTMSPIGDSFDRSLDNINNNNNVNSSNESPFIKPLSQVSTFSTLDSEGKVKVIVPIEQRRDTRFKIGEELFSTRSDYDGTLHRPQQQPQVLTPILSRGERRNISGNTVTLKVTDEAGNVTNQKKLPAQPSFITRSTSEKVPNRSQILSDVQRTWARHTTK